MARGRTPSTLARCHRADGLAGNLHGRSHQEGSSTADSCVPRPSVRHRDVGRHGGAGTPAPGRYGSPGAGRSRRPAGPLRRWGGALAGEELDLFGGDLDGGVLVAVPVRGWCSGAGHRVAQVGRR